MDSMAAPMGAPAPMQHRGARGGGGPEQAKGKTFARRERIDTGAPASAPPPPPSASMPAAPRAPVMKSMMADKKAEAAKDTGIDARPYITRLNTLADELVRAAGAPVPSAAAQLPVSRLGELLEDLRTVGLDDVARQLTPILDRLRGALVSTDLVRVLTEAATALRALVPSGGGDAGGTRKKGWAFWR